ncbi:hypothetical protein H5410_016808 [Solanum commersonii]|uniref:Uncharacterized protein n=1 Tax=Solanum commersonii TaxID=4109 RepID=A0A9J5ZXL9_SOLCO|nr:hypothetical protein H5410_016808 [Solanum commersonii]
MEPYIHQIKGTTSPKSDGSSCLSPFSKRSSVGGVAFETADGPGQKLPDIAVFPVRLGEGVLKRPWRRKNVGKEEKSYGESFEDMMFWEKATSWKRKS